jgi:phosphoribosyl-AMP cyclohydrolase
VKNSSFNCNPIICILTSDIFPMNIDFEKGNGLVPTIIQDATTRTVLMLGYMTTPSTPPPTPV